jgi:glutamyl-tRNA reductase
MMPEQLALVLVGTNHRHAPIGVREQLAARAHGRELIGAVTGEAAVIEGVGVSTCNRCEIYMVGEDSEAMQNAAIERLAAYAHRSPAELEPLLYTLEGAPAVEHLFSVAAGLDSMVPGEAQILAQLRDAYADALDLGSTGPVSNRLFHQALEAGKRVRHETAIGELNASVASVAASLVRDRLGSLEQASVLVVGAGKIAELVATNLHGRGAREIVVANRDPDRAAAVAGRFGGRSVGLDGLAGAVAEADVVVGSTLSEGYLVTPQMLTAGRPRVLVDLALPRDIDPACGEVEGVTLVNVDDLEQDVRRNISLREGEAQRAREIVVEEVASFRGWMAALEVVPAITSLRALAEEIRLSELERMDGRWESLSPHDRERLDQLTRSMLNKLLHRPTVRLKELAAEGGENGYAEAVSELFGLEPAKPAR